MKRKICVIDAETDPFRKGRVPQPFLWGFYDGATYLEFSTTKALADYLDGEDIVCYAHNGGKFDFHYLLPYLEPHAALTIINGRIAKMHIGMCELRDSVCILPVPLAAYKKDQIDYSTFESGRREEPAIRAKISEYLFSDCCYLYDMVTAFYAKYGGTLTQASAAMNQWRAISKSAGLPDMADTGREFYNAIAPYYYGGRVECFESGIIDTDFSVYDINSAYPFAMLQEHPYSAEYETFRGFVPHSDFYRVRCVSRGAFPFRGLGGENDRAFGLTFPRDDEIREYTVTRWEYDAAIETDSISRVTVLESLRFLVCVTLASYVDKFWRERQEAKRNNDVLGSLFTKLLLNSLYGKFSADPSRYREYITVPREDAADLMDPDCSYSFGGELGPWLLGQRPLPAGKARYYNVATGASITGYVRAMLWRAMHESKGVMYCDTDSVACRQRGAPINLGDELGAWKHEGRFDRAGIAGKKLYIFRGAPDEDGRRVYKTASKGVKLTRAQLWRVASGGNVEYESEVPTFSVHKPASFVERTVRKTA